MSEHGLFATLRSDAHIWAIAAIHGEAGRLADLHSQIYPLFRPGDQVVYLGNYSGRGPMIRETIDQMLMFRRALLAQSGVKTDDVVFLRGGQEEMWQKLLQLQLASSPSQVLNWMVDQGVGETIISYGARVEDALLAARDGILSLTKWTSHMRHIIRHQDGHTALMSVLRHAAFTSDHSMLFVHAGLNPALPLLEQSDHFWWGGGRFTELDAPFEDFRKIIRGYDRAHGGVSQTDFTVTLDNKCGFGGSLMAGYFAPGGELLRTVSA